MQPAHDHSETPTPLDARREMERKALGLYRRIADDWRLSLVDAAALLDVATSDWLRIRAGVWRGQLSREQLMRLSGIIGIYRTLDQRREMGLPRDWVTQVNDAPGFDGARPIDAMIKGGFAKILSIRIYLDSARAAATL